MLEEFGPSLYSADGSIVSFFGFPYPTRMAVARLSDGSVWVWSPVALTDELADEVQTIGPVRYIVSPNKLHHLFLYEWTDRWPEARLYAPPGLARKKPELPFYAELSDEPSPSWAADIDQVVFRGSLAMEEVAFFHRASRTAIIGDLIQRHSETTISGWKVWDKTERKDGTFSVSDFQWQEQANEYRCPEGHALRSDWRSFKKPRTRITNANTIIFRSSQFDCAICPNKDRCCPNTPIRKIARSVHERARDVARRIYVTPDYQRSRRERKKVEMLFAHLKRILKLDRLRLRGFSGASDEFTLAAAVQNLRRMTKLIAQGPPIDGIGASA